MMMAASTEAISNDYVSNPHIGSGNNTNAGNAVSNCGNFRLKNAPKKR